MCERLPGTRLTLGIGRKVCRTPICDMALHEHRIFTHWDVLGKPLPLCLQGDVPIRRLWHFHTLHIPNSLNPVGPVRI